MISKNTGPKKPSKSVSEVPNISKDMESKTEIKSTEPQTNKKAEGEKKKSKPGSTNPISSFMN